MTIINEKKPTYHTFRSSFLLAGLFLFKQGFLCFFFFGISVFFMSDLKFYKRVYNERKQLTLLKRETNRANKV